MNKILSSSGDVLFEYDSGNLSGLDLSHKKMNNALLTCQMIEMANFSFSNLRGSVFDCSCLSGSNFRGADLSYTNLYDCDLSGCDFTGANFHGANLSRSFINGANFNGANLTETKLEFVSLISIIMWPFTVIITPNNIRIGSKAWTIDAWKNIDCKELSNIHSEAIDYYNKNNELIVRLCERFSY